MTSYGDRVTVTVHLTRVTVTVHLTLTFVLSSYGGYGDSVLNSLSFFGFGPRFPCFRDRPVCFSAAFKNSSFPMGRPVVSDWRRVLNRASSSPASMI